MMRKPDNSARHTATVATMKTASVRSRRGVETSPGDGRHEELRQRYTALLKRFIDQRAEEDLLEVYRLGREAVVGEIGLLSVIELHHAVLCDVLADLPAGTDGTRYAEIAGTVLSEFLSPYEMSSRGYREASTAMRHVNEMLEDEIRRVAHAIHDGAGQYLACVHISLYGIAKHVAAEGRQELQQAHALLDELERDLRHVSHELRPRVLENAGLAGAVDFLVDGVAKRAGLDIHVDNQLTERPPAVVETALYRCIQEMLNNIVKHAKAENVQIGFGHRDSDVYCEVSDDGVGFDTRDAMIHGGRQLGFLGIRERVAVLGGKVDIESTPGKGTHITIRVPR